MSAPTDTKHTDLYHPLPLCLAHRQCSVSVPVYFPPSPLMDSVTPIQPLSPSSSLSHSKLPKDMTVVDFNSRVGPYLFLSRVKPRPIIVKLASRRTKTRLMKSCKNLKENPVICNNGTNAKVYISDDLTKRRANIAFKARQLKRDKLISDTWTHDSNILVKDNYGRIKQVNTQQDISKFK